MDYYGMAPPSALESKDAQLHEVDPEMSFLNRKPSMSADHALPSKSLYRKPNFQNAKPQIADLVSQLLFRNFLHPVR